MTLAMIAPLRFIGLAMLLVSGFTSAACARCGVERWPVKTGTDSDAGQVSTAAQATTITALTQLPPPADPDLKQNSRFAPTELQTFRASGTLKVIKRETDEDYHLIIADPSNPAVTMIVEAPNPRCADGSVFFQNIADVRAAIEDKFGPIQGRLEPFVAVTVVGVAFFDRFHDQEGVAPNVIELHPLLSIRFN
jgi:hypothetical protein